MKISTLKAEIIQASQAPRASKKREAAQSFVTHMESTFESPIKVASQDTVIGELFQIKPLIEEISKHENENDPEQIKFIDEIGPAILHQGITLVKFIQAAIRLSVLNGDKYHRTLDTSDKWRIGIVPVNDDCTMHQYSLFDPDMNAISVTATLNGEKVSSVMYTNFYNLQKEDKDDENNVRAVFDGKQNSKLQIICGNKDNEIMVARPEARLDSSGRLCDHRKKAT